MLSYGSLQPLSLINRSSGYDDVGLFGVSSGTIKNVGLIDVNVEGSATVGSLLGSNRNEVSNCFATGQVSSATGTAGGLVGSNSDTIRTSYSRVSVVNTL